MKKILVLGVIFVLLAVTAVPVMAAKPGNGHGNGNNPGQGNSADTQDQETENNRNQTRVKIRNRSNNSGFGVNGNQSHSRMRTPFYLQGTITAINAGDQTITVNLYHGNAQVKQYLGKNLELQASNTTLVFKITQGDDSEGGETEGTKSLVPTTSNEVVSGDENEGPSDRVSITLSELQAGQNVAIHGNVVDTVYNVRLITVYIRTPIGQPITEKP